MNSTTPTGVRFRGIVFDMDGVLCDSEAFICEAAMRMFAERHHVEVRPEDFLPFVGAGEDRYLGGVAQQYGIAWDLHEDKKRTYDIYLEITTSFSTAELQAAGADWIAPDLAHVPPGVLVDDRKR